MSADWTLVGALEDVPRRGARTLRREAGPPIAVFRTGEDEIFALIDRCPHRGGPLSEGIVSGRTVACPLHNWVIELETGEAKAPDVGCAPSVPARVESGRIYLRLPISQGASAAAEARWEAA
jgi:nitrite reductase (NADH) small subunit